MKTLNIGLVGYGFMGRTHTNGYKRVNDFFPELQHRPVLKAVCGRTAEKAKEFADQWQYESIETDWRELVKRDDIDAIDICTPNNTHAEIAIAAAEAGKMILCEKPLALNPEQGEQMCAAVEKAGVPNTVWYNYRRVPAVTMAKQLIDEGRLGRIFHYRANFLQDWTISEDVPQGGAALWRLDVAAAGSGVTGDLLAHCIDTAIWLNGSVTDVSAMTETFVKERMHTETGKVEPVGIDDACAFLCHFENGSLGLFESTRYARGHKALYTLEINGENASIRWDLHDLHRLEFFDHSDEGRLRGWRSIHVSDHGGDQPYMDKWWVPGLQIGYEHTFVHQVADFIKSIEEGVPCSPTFREAQETQPPLEETAAGVEMVLIAGGWFEMGSAQERELDEPLHRVYVGPFFIDKHEVTQAEYERVMGANPSRWKGANNPVEQIRWANAAAYCNARSRLEGLREAYDLETWQCDFEADGYRLPTEAEWEYAARAGTTTEYFFGDGPARLKDYAWFKENCTRRPRPVGSRKPNAWGLYDVYGNVWEWCHDFYGENYYRESPERDPQGPAEGENRVVRGGCWNSRPDECRSAYRNYEDPGYTDVCFGKDIHGFVGFRCVKNVE